MSRFTVVIDANIFYPAPLRDLMLRLMATGLFRGRWTEKIHEEWTRNLLIDRPDLADRIPKTVEKINSSFLDCLVNGYEHFIPCIHLPDLDDRHVVAAAIKAGAEVIVTSNLKDFPPQMLEPYGIEAIHPDDFFVDVFDLHPAKVLEAVAKMRRGLVKPPMDQDEFLGCLRRQGLPQTAATLEKYKPAI
ncbi:MAG: PIN domain-containing protein [Rhodocyclaceae bacterium]|nr:MAG: PIN domain-containing protein [Rhodocyclaceae bacterium]